MKKLMLSLVIVFIANCACFSQYSVRLVVTGVATKKLEDVYVAGNFNNWDPGQTAYKLNVFGAVRKAVVLNNVPAGRYEFKFTRGKWDWVETDAKGNDIDNRVIEITGDTSINCTIEGWKDDFPDKPKPSTVSANVRVIDTAFFMPQLNRYRRIWIYLPASYDKVKTKSYPVLYMHDGQNLFNEQTAPFGEWGVDECLDTLETKINREWIVVGIDNGGDKRMNEYNPYDNERFGKGEGAAYMEFLVKTLKPFIDKNYRTLKGPKQTGIAGSSMGGLISMYAVMKYPEVFGIAGIFSPAFWVAPDMYKDLADKIWQVNFPRFYFYAGEKEGDSMVADMQKVADMVQKKNCCHMQIIVFPYGQHKEKYWRDEFDDFYRWMAQ